MRRGLVAVVGMMVERLSRAARSVFFRLRERKRRISDSSSPKCLARSAVSRLASRVLSYWWPVKMARGVIMIRATSSER